MQGHCRIGTSGWSYPHWRARFYPDDLPKGRWLEYYLTRFDSVEINNSFYRLPEDSTFKEWRDAAPEGFIYSVKASRYITHMKKLKDPHQTLSALFDRITVLEDKLGPILFQLPPRWRCNVQRLEAFLAALSADFRYSFEFRDKSWLNEEIYALLSRHNAALCMYELDGFVSPQKVTADFVYVRLHGPAGPYQGDYDRHNLKAWAAAFSKWSDQGCDVYGYFDNDQDAYAAHNALSLQSLLEK